MRSLEKLLLLCLLGLSSSLSAQSLLETLYPEASKGEPLNIFEKQAAFDTWAEGKDLENLKGWKPLKRHLEIELSRVNSDGYYPDTKTYYEAVQEVMASRAGAQDRSGGAWWPVGPFGFPEPITNSHPGVGRVNCVVFHPVDSNTIYIGIPDGGIWKTTNAGESWIPLGDDLPVPGVSAIHIDPSNPDIIYIATGDSEYSNGDSGPSYGGSQGYGRGMGVFKSTDGGQTWSETGLQTNPVVHDLSLLNSIIGHPDSTQHLLASGPLGIWKSTNGGDNWAKTNLEPVEIIEQDAQNPNIIFGASSNLFNDNSFNKPTILRSTDFGDTWEELPVIGGGVTTARMKVRVAPSDSNRVYVLAVANNSGLYGIYRSDDGGDNWNQLISGDSLNLLGWRTGNPDNDTGGQGWYDIILCVDPENADRVFVGGVNLWGSEDGGETWSLTAHSSTAGGPSVHADLHQMRINPHTGDYYICSDGGILRTKDLIIADWETQIEPCIRNNGSLEGGGCFQFPTVWEDVSKTLAITQFYKIDVFNSDDNYIIGGTQDNSHFRVDDGQWFKVFGGDGMDCAYHPNNPEIIVASSQNGNLNLTEDNGFSYDWGISNEPKDQGAAGNWITPFVSTYEEPYKVFVGFNETWEYDYNTDSWTKLSDFPGNSRAREVAICQSNPDAIATLFSGSSQATRQIYLTKDHGQTWNEITTNLFVLAFATPWDICFGNTDDEIYIAFSGYAPGNRVWRTLDGGQTWQNITKGLPKIPVVSIDFHFNSLNNQVYIGTDMGVFYTNDDLNEWVPYHEGLPILRIQDLEVHPVSNKLYAGTYGRGLWANDLIPTPLVNTDAPGIYEASISLSPNPSAGPSLLKINDLEPGEYQLRTIDVQGRILTERNLTIASPEWQTEIGQNLNSGLYYIQLTDGKHSNTVKLLVEN